MGDSRPAKDTKKVDYLRPYAGAESPEGLHQHDIAVLLIPPDVENRLSVEETASPGSGAVCACQSRTDMGIAAVVSGARS
jgi:hypothetical protein